MAKKLKVREDGQDLEVSLTDVYQRMFDMATYLTGRPMVRTYYSELRRQFLTVGGNWLYLGYRRYQLESGEAIQKTFPADGRYPEKTYDNCKSVPEKWTEKINELTDQLLLIFLEHQAAQVVMPMNRQALRKWERGWTTTVVEQIAKLARKHKCQSPDAKRAKKMFKIG